MVNELKPCPFCGGRAERIEITEDDGFENRGGSAIECQQCRASSHVEFGRKENLISAWNTRPAAPAEGLETVETQMRCLLQTGNHQWRNPRLPSELSFIRANGKDETGIPYELRELVTRKNAEAIIAAKDADSKKLEDAWYEAEGKISDLEADNKRLREALEPFANVAEYDIGDDENDGDIFWPMSNARYSMAGRLRVGDLRRARAALG